MVAGHQRTTPGADTGADIGISVSGLDGDTESIRSKLPGDTKNREWWTQRMAEPQSRGTSIDLRSGLTGILGSSIRKSAKFYTYGGVTPYTGTDWLGNGPAEKELALGLQWTLD